MPRRRTNWRDSNGTNTTSPRQFAPIVMTSGESEVALARRVLAEIHEI